MSLIATFLAVLVLLVTPGPTNTLLAVAGAERGWRGAVRLIPAELTGYLLTVVPLSTLGASLLAGAPQARTVLTLVAAAWVLWLSLSLWRKPAVSAAVAVTARRIFVTTLLNPKALVFGLVLMPESSAGRFGANLSLLVAGIVGVAMLWAALGAGLRGGASASAGLPRSWRRAAALWLGALAVYLVSRVAAA